MIDIGADVHPGGDESSGQATATVAVQPDEAALAAERALIDWFRERGSALVGYSGGVDSTYLAAVALDALGPEHMVAVLGVSASVPGRQAVEARERAEQLGIPIREIPTYELDDPAYASNPSNRCYHCKSELWNRLGPLAAELGFAVVCDGTNADDVRGYRPGMRAASERAVSAPLAEVGLTKASIRALSYRRGLPTWNIPAAPCLASRLPYGFAVTVERLQQVDRAEAALRELGIPGDLRVRHHGELARIELTAEELDDWLQPSAAERLAGAVKSAGFTRVAIDLGGFRSGSLNVLGGLQ